LTPISTPANLQVVATQNTIDKALDRLPEQLRLQQIG
jgi:hypothetical protein